MDRGARGERRLDPPRGAPLVLPTALSARTGGAGGRRSSGGASQG